MALPRPPLKIPPAAVKLYEDLAATIAKVDEFVPIVKGMLDGTMAGVAWVEKCQEFLKKHLPGRAVPYAWVHTANTDRACTA